MAEIPYVYREDVMSALDVKPSAYMARQLDRACNLGSRMVESFCHRIFYPLTATRTFDYPGDRSTPLLLWLDANELVSASAVSSDGVTIPANTGYLLRPDDGPPYDRIEIERDSSYSFAGGPQRAISITGVYAGAPVVEVTETTLASAIVSTSATTVTVSRPAGGVGAVLRIGQERLLLIGKGWAASGVFSPSLASSATANSMSVADGSIFTEGETLLLESERVRVEEIAGNTLIIRRAVDGSSLAAHGAVSIFWQHTLVVERGVLGTTAAIASNGATVLRWEPPSAVRALAQAYAEDEFLQQNSGYARTSGSGDNERPVSGRGVRALEQRMEGTYRRKVRMRTV